MTKNKQIYNIETVSEELGIPVTSIRKLISDFFATAQSEFYDDIISSISGNDYGAIYHSFHALKGPLSWLSLNDTREICQQACDNALTCSPVDFNEYLERIKSSLQEVKESLFL